MNWLFKPRPRKRRALLLQSLEERILWDATLAPEAEPTETDQATELEQAPSTDEQSLQEEQIDHILDAEIHAGSNLESSENDDEIASEKTPGEEEDFTLNSDADLDTAQDTETIDPNNSASELSLENTSSVGDIANLQSEATDNVVQSVLTAADTSADDRQNAVADLSAFGTQVVVIDARIEDYEALISDAGISADEGDGSTLLVHLKQDQNGIEQVTNVLKQLDDVSALHIVSHGDDGLLYLGNQEITIEELSRSSDELSNWGDSFTEDADILLYGCDVAETETGKMFVDRLAQVTGADVAASTNDTGTADHGGDWVLEYSEGIVSAEAIIQSDGIWSGQLASAVASGSVTSPEDVMIDESSNILLTFENTGPDTGYAPFGDFVVDRGIDVNGISYLGAPVVDFTAVATWNATAGQWESSPGSAVSSHPFEADAGGAGGLTLPDGTGLQDGASWYSFKLPFGSFVSAQPVARLAVDADFNNDAVVGQSISMFYTPGFLLGCDETGADDPHVGATSSSVTTPSVIQIEKVNDLPEAETPTGPNYPVRFFITVNIAQGETIDNLVVEDYLPSNANFIGTEADVSVTGINGATLPPGASVSFDTPTNPGQITIDIGNVTGTAVGAGEILISYVVWFEDIVNDGTDPTINSELSLNESSVTGDYNGEVVSDNEDLDVGGPDGSPDDGDFLVEAQNLTTQKGVELVVDFNPDGTPILGAPQGLSPGDILLWTIEIQVSDYHAFDNLEIEDILSDGQDFLGVGVSAISSAGTLSDATPTITVNNDTNFGGITDDSLLGTVQFAAGNITSSSDPDGFETIVFNISQQLRDAGGDGVLVGDLNAAQNGVIEAAGETETTTPVLVRLGPGATTATLTFYSQIQETYTPTNPDLVGDIGVNAGDPISNDATVSGDVGDVTDDSGTFAPLTDATGSPVNLEDDTDVALEVSPPSIRKYIYAVNGVEIQSTNIDEDDNEADEAILAGIQPGDIITYRLRATLNSANGENLIISDFLPLPVYDAGGEFLLDPEFANSLPVGAAPGASQVQSDLAGVTGGTVLYGEDYNLHTVGLDFNIITPPDGVAAGTHPLDGTYPDVTLDANSNALYFDFGTFEELDAPPAGESTPVVLDLLLSITLQDLNFQDGLFLTNQTQISQADSFGEVFVDEAIVQIGYLAPALTLTKGVVALSGTSNGTITPDAPAFGINFDNTDPGAGAAAGDALAFDADGVTLDDLAGGAGILGAGVSDVDGADWIRYALTLQNSGQGDAQDILISDSLPQNTAGADGFVLPANSTDSAALISALNLQVFYGDGTRVSDSELTVSVVSGALMVEIASEIDGRTLDDNGLEVPDSDEIRNDANPGNGDPSDVVQNLSGGDEILILTYDLQLDNETSDDATTSVAADVFDNTATIEEYFQTAEDDPVRDNENNRALLDDPADLTDGASVVIASPSLEKTLLGTELITPNNDESNQVIVGERLSYEVRVTVPEGQILNAVINDFLDPGLELSSIDSIEMQDQDGNPRNGIVTSDVWGPDLSGFTQQTDASDPNITYNFSDAGRSQLLLSLGNLTNTDTDNTTDEVIVVTYTVMVTNDSGSEQGIDLNNEARLDFEDSAGTALQSDTDSAENVTLLEPLLEVVKTVEVDGVASSGNPNDETNPDTVRGDAGDPVVYTIVIQHTGDSDTDAYDVNFEDLVPPDIVNVVLVDAIYSAGGIDLVASGDIVQSGNTLSTANDFTVELGETVTITVTGEIGASVGVGDLIDNTAVIDWTSYPEIPDGTDFLPAGEEDVERGGGDSAPVGGEINDYEDEDPARIQVGANEIEKFLVNSEITDEPDASADGELAVAVDADGVNRGAEAVIGETLSYQVVITLAEGESASALVQDSLDPGLALISIDAIYTQQLDTSDSSISNIAAVPNLTVPGLGAGQALPAPATAPGGIVAYTENGGTGGGDLITIDFGDIDNANDDDAILEQIVIQYTVMVRDEAGNVGGGTGVPGTSLSNAAQMTWQNSTGAAQATSPDSADPVEVIEPDLEVLKDVSVDGPGDAGDEVTYTLVIQHTAISEADAFDVSLYDELPDQVDFTGVDFATGVNVTITDTLGTLGTADLEIDPGAGTNGALQFAATLNTSIDATAAGSSQNTVDMPLSPAARVITITITGVLDDSVEPGDIISNEAEINYSSLDEHNDGTPDGDDEDDRSGFVADGTEGERDYSDNDPADDFTIPGPAIFKELVGSDVDSADNAENQATIGEIVTYRVIVDVPEGSMSNAQIVDTLTPGLEFVDVFSITGVANGSSVISNTIDLEDPSAVGISTVGTAATGQAVTFSFGDIVATGDNDGAPPVAIDQGLDQIIIEYRVVVQDIPLNVDGAVRDNSANFQFETTNEAGETVAQSTATVNAEDITLIEPELEVIKTVNGEADGDSAGPLDAGDTVTYTIVIQHSGASTTDAYDVDFTDAIPGELENVTIDSAIYSLDGSDLAGTDIIITGNAVTTANPFTVLFGETITIAVSGEIVNAAGPGEIITNTAEIDWTSLPEGHENDGAPAERGEPSDPDDVYSDSDTAEFFTDVPEFSKGVISTSIHGDGGDGEIDLTIGEQVTFELVVTLPEGTTPVVVTDNLPPLVALAPFTGDTDGVLEVVGAEVSFVGAGILASSTGLAQGDNQSSSNISVNDISGDGFSDQVIFNFGLVEVDGNNVTTADDNLIRVTVTAVVKNLPGTGGATNENGDELTNEATLNFAADPANPGPGQVLIDDATVDIIEPELEIDKEFVDPSTGLPIISTVTPGDTVRIRLEVTNTGSANAYDVAVSDSYNSDQPVFENPVAATVPAGFIYAADPGAPGFSDDEVSFTSGPGVFIAPGVTQVFEFDVMVTEAEIGIGALEGLTVANTATVTGDSLDGDNPEERDTSDDDTDILFGDPDLEKSIISTSVVDTASGEFDGSIEDVTIGETVTYQLLITLPETDLNNNGISELSELVATSLTDNLPDNLDLVSARVVSIGSDITMSNFVGGETLGDPDIIGSPGDASVTFNLGDIAVIDVGGDGSLADQQVVIEVTAIVKDDPLNSADADKVNVATLNYGGEAFIDSATVEIVVPALEVTKNFLDPATGEPVFALEAGEDVLIELVIENTGSSVAYDVSATDDLTSNVPAFFDSNSAAVVATAGFTFDATGDIVTFSGGTLAAGASVTLSFTVTISAGATLAPGSFVNNTASVSGDTLPAGDPNESEQRVIMDDDTDQLATPGIAKAVVDSSHSGTGDGEFTVGTVDLTVGEVVTYAVTISIPNTLDDTELTLVGTSVIDTLPVGFALLDARVVSIGGNTTSGATSGGEIVDSASPLVTGGPVSTFLGVGDSLISGSANITGAVGGGSVTFDFGGLALNDANGVVGAEQSIVVQIDAVVTDDLVNNGEGALRTNSASLLWEEIPGDPVELAATADVEIVAPELEIEKFFIDPATGSDAFIVEAGDQLTALLEVTNNGSANAYDVLVEDEVDLTNWIIVGPVTTPPGFIYSLEDGVNPTIADTVTYTMNSSGDATNPNNFVAPGETVVFEFTLEYTGAADQTTQILNTAEVVGDSLPDDEIVVIPGVDTERTTEDAGVDVVYEGPQLDKTVFSTSVSDTGSGMFDSFEDLTIGETVTYELVITLPETDMDGDDAIDPLTELVGTTITDSLPVNLTLVDAEVISVGADVVTSNFTGGESLLSGDPDITGPAGGLSVTFDLGDVGVLDQNGNADLTEQQVIVQVTAIVTDDPANSEEDPADPTSNDKENVATLNFGTEVLQDTATVEIVEPVLEVTKNFLDPLTGQPIFAAESGEIVRISIDVENAGSATAYDVLVTDDLNSNIPTYIDAGSASLVAAPGFVFAATGDVVTFSGGTIGAGDVVTLSFDVTLADPITLGQNEIIRNTALVTGNSLPPGDPNISEQRTTTDEDDDELYGLPAIIKEVADNYDDVPPGDADFEATSHQGTDSSQFDPTLPDLTIGEVVTYEVTVVIPNTYDDPDLTTIATSITDTLPVGLGLIDARVVAIGGNRVVGATDGGEFVNDTNAAVTGGPASSGLAVGASLVAGSANISGTIGGSTVTFDFGGLAVDARIIDESGDGDAGADDDDLVGDEQTIVVQIDAVILDEANNSGSDVKTNVAQLTWEETVGDPIVIEDDAEIEIVEPELEITKSFIDPNTGVDVYTVGEGDQVVAVLNVTNNGSANVYDVIVSDEIDLVNWIIIGERVTPPGFIYSVEDGVSAVPADTVTYTMNSSIDATNPDNFVAPGETVNIEFVLQYTGADDGGAQIDNTAGVTGNSLPANEVIVIPGLDTVRDTEDEGSDFVYEDPGLEKVVVEGLNPDTGSEQHDPALVDLNIGEQVTYELTITLPESLLDASGAMIPVTVNLIDDLPGGFTVVGAEITGIGSAVAAADLTVGSTLTVLDPATLGPGVPAATDDPDISSADVNFPAPAGGDGFDDQVLFSFGGVTVENVDNLALQTISVRVTAVVMDVEPENVDGEIRTNDATLEFFGTPTGDPTNPFDEIVPIEITDSADVEIVEPELEIEKTFLNAAGTAEVETVTSGDTITVQLTVTNTGTGPAYDLVIEDPLDPTKFNISTVSPVSTPAAFMFSLSGNSVVYTLDSGAGTPGSAAHVVTPGESVVLTFTVQVLEGIGPDTALNTATVDGDSAPGDNPFERDEPTKEGTDELDILPVPPPISPASQALSGLEDAGESETLADRVLRTYRYDILDRLRDEYDELFEQIRRDLQRELPKLSANYMATGITEHGSNVTLIVYDETGAIIGYSSTLADTAGNWTLSFPQTILDKSPHHVEVQVSPASINESTAGQFNTRVYFTPATDARVSHYKGLQVGDVIAEQADSLLDSMHQGNQNPFGSPGAGWNHPYEFLGTASIENL